jgi:hypothetical protein
VSKHVDEVILQYLETDNLKAARPLSDANVAVPYYAKSWYLRSDECVCSIFSPRGGYNCGGYSTFPKGRSRGEPVSWGVNRGLRLVCEGLQRSNIFKLKVNPALHKQPTRCYLGDGETCVKDDSQSLQW